MSSDTPTPQDTMSPQHSLPNGNGLRRPRNVKNLQLDLSKNQTKYPVPLTYSSNGNKQVLSHSPTTTPRTPRLYRTPSLNTVLMSSTNSPTQTASIQPPTRSLTLSINSSNGHHSQNTAQPATAVQQSLESTDSLAFSSSSTVDSSGSLSAVTEVPSYHPSGCVKAYPEGPVCVLEPNLFLYSEPSIAQLIDFDVIINVAQEIKDYTDQISNKTSISGQNIQYFYIPWTHTSKLMPDFPKLTEIIDKALSENKRVLIHCQCGVSRSASLILAYLMKHKKIGYNDAYNMLKEKAPLISPNFSLIYEVMEWGRYLGYSSAASSTNDM